MIRRKDSADSLFTEKELGDRSTFNPLFSPSVSYLLSPGHSSLFHFVVRLLAGLKREILDGFQWIHVELDGKG